MVAVFGVFENREGFVAMEADLGFQVLPFVVVNLDGELLGAAIVAAVGNAVLDLEAANFFAEFFTFYAPRDEDGMSGTVDKAESFGGGFVAVGFGPIRAAILGIKTGLAGNDVGFIPVVGFGACLPDGLLEVMADGSLTEEIVGMAGQNMGASDAGVGLEIGEAIGDGVIGGLKVEGPAFDRVTAGVAEFAVAIAATGGLSEGVEAAFGTVKGGEADIDSGFDELGGDEDDGSASFAEAFGLGKNEHDMSWAHAGGEMKGSGVPT